ncbi:hypothetical protein Tco_0578962 [Tanacetum coccineum]
MDDPNITMEEYIRLEEEKARRHVSTVDTAYSLNENNVYDTGLTEKKRDVGEVSSIGNFKCWSLENFKALIHHHMGGSHYLIPCSILSTWKDHKTPQRYPDVPTTSWRIFIQSMDSFLGLTLKSHSSRHRPLASNVLSTSDRHLIELENQVQRLMEAHLTPTQPTQVNKIATSCEICSGPHDTQYCMEDPEQAFAEYASSRTNEAGDPQCSTHIHSSINAITIHPKQPEESQVNEPDVGQEEKGNLRNINSNPHSQPDPLASIATKHLRKLNSMLESLELVP